MTLRQRALVALARRVRATWRERACYADAGVASS